MIRFITHHNIGKDLRGNWNSAGPSGRLRCIYPSQLLSKCFGEVQIHSLFYGIDKELISKINRDDVVIVSKLINRGQVEFIRHLKQHEVRCIIDFCDNYFDSGEHQSITHDLLSLADVVTANTPEMTNVIRRQGVINPERVIYVPDAVDVSASPPRVRQYGTIRLLSYGNRLVCNHLSRWIPSLYELSRSVDLSLEVVTSLDEDILKWISKTNEKLDERFQISLTKWNEFAIEEAFKRCDIVLIPSDPNDNFNYTKSTNRLVECINRGKPVVAFPLPAYMSFDDVLFLTDNVADGISKLRKMEHEEKLSRIKNAQARVRILFSDQSLLLAWTYAIKTLIGLRRDCLGNHASIIKGLSIFKIQLEMAERMLNFRGDLRVLIDHLFGEWRVAENIARIRPSAKIQGVANCVESLLHKELIDFQEARKIEKVNVERNCQVIAYNYSTNTWRLPMIYEHLRINFSNEEAIAETLVRLTILWDDQRNTLDGHSKRLFAM
jgi:hypothetical protein